MFADGGKSTSAGELLYRSDPPDTAQLERDALWASSSDGPLKSPRSHPRYSGGCSRG